jgi:hypothetical protein
MILATFGRIAAIALVMGALAACAPVPIHNITNRAMPPTAERLTQQEIDTIIVTEAAQRGWRIDPIAPGHMKGTLDIRSHRAVVDILADKANLNIRYLESTNLDEKNGVIDRKYNQWVANLEKDITTAVAAAGTLKAINR